MYLVLNDSVVSLHQAISSWMVKSGGYAQYTKQVVELFQQPAHKVLAKVSQDLFWHTNSGKHQQKLVCY